MNTAIALFKKDLHAAKWFLLGGLLFFWGFPLVQLAGNYYQFDQLQADMPSSMAIVFGALYTIITAAGLVCLDLPGRLYEFWRSKPIRLMPHLLVKYILGLVIVLFVITIPVWLEIALSQYDGLAIAQKIVLYCHTFIIILIYSVAFCIGHLIRNMTESVVISCAIALLIYFVPVLVPAMESFSFFNLLFLRPPASFYELLTLNEFTAMRYLVVTAIVLSVILFASAWVCLKRHLQIQLGLKSMCWCLGLIMLAIFLAAAFSVGSNLKCLAQIPLHADLDRMIISSCFDDNGGAVLRGRFDASKLSKYNPLQIDRISEEPSYLYRSESYSLEMPLPSYGFFLDGRRMVWSKHSPDLVYFLAAGGQPKEEQGALRAYSLYVLKLDSATHTARLLSELFLGEYNKEEWKYYQEDIRLDYPTLYVLLPGQVAIIDVGNEQQPQLLAKSTYQPGFSENKTERILSLPSDKTLSQQQRLYIAQYFCDGALTARDWNGDKYTKAGNDSICIYQKKEISDLQIRLEKIAECKLLPLEKLLYSSARKVILGPDMLYILNAGSSLTVYQLNETAGMLKRIGHYAVPESFYDMFLRDDGNIALVGPRQIHIVQPPAIKNN